MFSIKSSFADCSKCEYLEHPSCVLDTNSKANLGKVDIMIIGDYPEKSDVNKTKPLNDIHGRKYRKYHREYLNKFKWLMTNVVLCQPPKGEEEIEDTMPEVIKRCKTNCFELIRTCKPKLILVMGNLAMNALGIAGSATNLRGNFFKWEDYNVLLTIHPGSINKNKILEESFESDIQTAAEYLGADVKSNVETQSLDTGDSGVHRYTIPNKYYTDEYRMVDVQYLNSTNQVLYIFRDKDNKKEYYKTDDEYICYQVKDSIPARKVVSYNDLNQVSISYREKSKLDPGITYEGDLRITAKHAMDYYHFNKGEAEIVSQNITFFDIEIDTGINNRTFPAPEEALYPINMVTCIYQQPIGSKKVCYVLDNQTEPIEDKPDTELKIFRKEKDLMKDMIKDWKNYDMDFISGWNCISFDVHYIFNRLPQLGIKRNSISKFNEFYVDPFRMMCKLPGAVVVDQDWLYKSFTFTKMENYKLGFIAQAELGITKIQLPLPFNEMYWKLLNTTIDYNIRDTELLEKLEDRLKHINLLNEIRTICHSSFEAASSSFGQVDSTMVSHLKSQGLASKNSDPHVVKKPYPGGYVHPPNPGIYDNITDFDFTSLYPSNIRTFNIGVDTFVMKTKDETIGYDLVYNPQGLPLTIDVIMDPTYEAKEKTIKLETLLKMIQDEKLIHTINGCFYMPHDKQVSSYSQVLEILLNTRSEYKTKKLDAKGTGNSKQAIFFDTKQKVYKVLANSLYGVIANKSFRFYDNSCAAAITLCGQEALKNSITEGDNFMRHLYNGKELVRPATLTKQEMYSNKMPNIKPEFIVTGDTDSIFCCFEKFNGEKSNKQIMEWCDKIQSYLNKEIINDIVKRHNVDEQYNRLELKNELIIARGLFLAKKRYAIHVVNNEGKDIDEMEYMGIEIKRSDYPSASKDFMKEVLDLIMKNKKVSVSNLLKFIKQKRFHFMKLIEDGDKTVARPCSYGKELDKYKSIPQGVKAMEAFNKISYNIHSRGSKAYMFRVSGIDESKTPPDIYKNYQKFIASGKKLEVVAIPDEEEKLPEYYIPDVKGNMKFAFEDRYELLLKPLLEVRRTKHLMSV